MRRLLFLLIIIISPNVFSQGIKTSNEDFTADKVNAYLTKYSVKIASLTDKVVLDGTLKNAGVFNTYSTLNSYIKLYELINTENSHIDFFNKSFEILNSSISTLISISQFEEIPPTFTIPVSYTHTVFFPTLELLNTGIRLTNEAIKLTAEDLDKKFLFNQLLYYKKMIEYNVSVDPYGDGYINDNGYLLSPTGQSYAPLDRTKLTSAFVKEWVLSNYEIVKNQKELEREARINAKKLQEYLEWKCNEIENYKSGKMTKALVNSDNSVIINNTGSDTLFNFVLTDNFLGIPLNQSDPITVLPYSKQQINLGNITATQINALCFKILGDDIKLNFNNQKLDFMSLMNVFHQETNSHKGYAPENRTIHLLILASGNYQNYTSTINYGDGAKEDTVHLNNGINSFVDVDVQHLYALPGNYTIKISTSNENGIINRIEQSICVLNPITMKLPLNRDLSLFPKTDLKFSADSVACVFAEPLNYLWDFNFDSQDFHVDKTGKNVIWNYDTDPSLFKTNNQVEYKVGLIVELLKSGITLKDTIFQTVKVSNPVVAAFNRNPSTNQFIIDVDSIPFKINLDASKSYSYKKESIQYVWSVDNQVVSQEKAFDYAFQTSGKHTINLEVTDGNYSKFKNDSLFIDFNVTYNSQSKVNQMEYFFDLDPGCGKGIQIPVTIENSVVSAKTTINCTNLSTGLHRIYFRVKDNLGKWSIPQSQLIIVQAFNPKTTQITASEYFFDSDPGVGNGISLPVQSSDSISISNIQNIQNISTGLHRIYFRVKDNLGNWSIPQSQLIIVQAFNPKATQITASEYFFDSDPGNGNGISMSVQSGDSISINTIQNIENISTGLHRIYFRVKDNLGNWSIPQSQLVIIQNGSSIEKINYAEYFFDSDPGFGKATKFVISSTNDLFINETLNIGSLSQGIHVINLRVRDESGKWSMPVSAQFEVIKDISTSTYKTSLNNESKYLIYGGENQFSVVTPNNQNNKYQLKVFDLNGKQIINKQATGSLKTTSEKGLYVVEIIDGLTNITTNQKIFVY